MRYGRREHVHAPHRYERQVVLLGQQPGTFKERTGLPLASLVDGNDAFRRQGLRGDPDETRPLGRGQGTIAHRSRVVVLAGQ